MKLLLDVKDDKAAFFMELLKDLPYVKTKTLTPEKAQFLGELKEAVDTVNLIKKGKAKGRPINDLLKEV
jgi:hypothetical protein